VFHECKAQFDNSIWILITTPCKDGKTLAVRWFCFQM